MSGLVLDIQRCAVHDGPGVRSVVFLKGCPLHCSWCCNPESISTGQQLYYRRHSCICCGACIAVCPHEALKAGEEKVDVDFGKCRACGLCAEACPSGSIGLYGKNMTEDEVLAVLKRDSAYYTESGGGVTISGGEALMQYEFAAELLELCKAEGWNTAVETTGYASHEALEKMLPVTDFFMFDYKLSDERMLREKTGADKNRILNSLSYLADRGAKIILRCILLPGLNDTEEHCREIAALQRMYPSICAVDVLPLHGYASSKYGDIGLPVPGIYDSAASEDDFMKFVTILQAAGVENVKKG